MQTGAVRFEIRVKPGAKRATVGGRVGGRVGAALAVAVTAPAVEGKATEAALRALAAAFGVRRSAVRLVSGATSRTKIVEVDGVDADAVERLRETRP